MKKKLLVGLAIGIIVSGLTGQAFASTIFEETVNGEAPSSGSYDLGALGLGSNLVIGSLPGGGIRDIDNFRFTIDTNYKVDHMGLFDFEGPGGTFVFGPRGRTKGIDANDIGINLLNLYSITDPLPEGTYFFSVKTGNNTNPRYAIDISVSSTAPVPVPVPASMLLFGTGLAGLAVSRLRRKKKA